MTDFSLKFLKLTAVASVIFLLSSGLIMAAECRTEFERANRSGGNAAEKINLLKRLIGICPEYGPALIGLARWHEKKETSNQQKSFIDAPLPLEMRGRHPTQDWAMCCTRLGTKWRQQRLTEHIYRNWRMTFSPLTPIKFAAPKMNTGQSWKNLRRPLRKIQAFLIS